MTAPVQPGFGSMAANEAALGRPLEEAAAAFREAYAAQLAELGPEARRAHEEAIVAGLRERYAVTWPEPEDRGTAEPSELAQTEYVDDLIRPGRIVVVAAEEGTGKSYLTTELGIRLATAGGDLAGTWPVRTTGPVLMLSEMHADDDFGRESAVLGALGCQRSDLVDRLYRLPLMTAAAGAPALTVPEWREWVTGWLRDHEALLLIVDTATGATQVDPWGRDIQAVYAALRLMTEAYPALAVVLVVHVRKPTGRGERRLSDVLGEWGRWCDVVVLLENDGASLERVRVSVRKRVRRERRIVAVKRGGLLVEPVDADGGHGSKVPPADVLAAVTDAPGMTYAELALRLGVSKDSVGRYVAALGDDVTAVPTGPRRSIRVYPAAVVTAAPPQTAAHSQSGGAAAVTEVQTTNDRRTAARTIYSAAVRAAVVGTADVAPNVECSDYSGHRSEHYRAGDRWGCRLCEGPA